MPSRGHGYGHNRTERWRGADQAAARYSLYSPGGHVTALAQILTPAIVLAALAKIDAQASCR